MSRSNAGKKSRRKKRLANRNLNWLPDEVHADVKGVARIANEIVPRGWEFDHDYSTEGFLTWYYPPSGLEASEDLDESLEPVTRIMLTDPEEPRVLLVGSGEGDAEFVLTVDGLFAQLDAIEAYRLGEPIPELG
jgi:hypothetical protein